MTAVGELVLVLGLLVSAHCEVRARDPEVDKEEEEALGGRAGGSGALPPPPHMRLHPGTTEAPPLGERARTGNWCAYVQKRVVTMAVAGGTERVSSRPVYAQRQKIFTVLTWSCCRGHGGRDCEDVAPDGQQDPDSSDLSGSEPERQELRAADVQEGDLSREQNDHHSTVSRPPDATDPSHGPTHHHHRHGNQQHLHPVGDEVDTPVYPEAPAALPVPHMLALVMSQLQPVLQGFNLSLEHLSQQVGDLARDVALLRGSHRGRELQPEPLDGPEQEEQEKEHVDAKLEEVFQQISHVRTQMERQRADMETRLRSQHAALSSVTTDMDTKLTRHQKMLQAVNTTLSHLKLDHDQSPEDHLEDHAPRPAHRPQLLDTSALWEAIERLDNMVVNNTVQVSALVEDVVAVQQLRRDLKGLREQIVLTGRNSQIQFMETGLEVEDAKVTVLRRVGELAANLTLQDKRLQEMDVDVDYLYTALYRNSSSDCSCNALQAAVARLEGAVANATELAADNRLALDESSRGEAEQWGKASYYVPAVEALQLGLQQVKESLLSEQERTTSLNHSLARLSSSLTLGLAEVSGLSDTNRKLREEMQFLAGNFHSLLKDAVRHSDVLELLLGEEVLEFLQWPKQQQEAHSIPALAQQLSEHSLKITALLENRPGDREPPSSTHHRPPDDMARSGGGFPARERQLLLLPEHEGDGSDVWSLKKMVEDLGLKVLRLEEKTHPYTNMSTEKEVPPAGVEAEVLWLKRGLEDHLSVFKNVFSNADVLAAANATLDLDKLQDLLKNKDGKKDKKRGGAGREGRGGSRRSRRDSAGDAPDPAGPAEGAVLFVALSPLGSHSSVGTFTARVDGLYLFILTLDLRPGPLHLLLRASGGAQVSLQQTQVMQAGPVTSVGLLLLRGGEEARLERRRGAWTDTEDNVFTVLLLHRTT